MNRVILEFFDASRDTTDRYRITSPFRKLVGELDRVMSDCPEKAVAMRALLEARERCLHAQAFCSNDPLTLEQIEALVHSAFKEQDRLLDEIARRTPGSGPRGDRVLRMIDSMAEGLDVLRTAVNRIEVLREELGSMKSPEESVAERDRQFRELAVKAGLQIPNDN